MKEIVIHKSILLKKYLKEDKTIIQIASELKCSKSTISNKLRKYDIKKLPEIYYCIDCHERKSGKEHERCRKCYKKFTRGKNAGGFKDGETLKKHYCKEPNCNNEISYMTWKNRQGRCKSCSRKGNLHPHWQGGISKLPYAFEFNKQLKEQIKKRDNYTCQNCGMTEEEHLIVIGTNLHVHHIDYNKMNSNEDNLITVCGACNTRANYNRDYWKEYFQNKIMGVNKEWL